MTFRIIIALCALCASPQTLPARQEPMQSQGSGTSRLPDSSPVYALHRQSGVWQFMFHGSVFLRRTDQDFNESGSRGGDAFDAPNWFMVMGQRPAGANGQLMLRGMMSLDRLTEGGSGYPLLFQTGESWRGQPLVDRQHPHDLFSELAIAYGRGLGHDTEVSLYVGLPGEPALGPSAFMHRPSAQSNPDAPLGHHWQDATHITFGVATAGLRYRAIKLEGSLFTGREPNEDRYDFDEPRFDSKSLRISINPTVHSAFQISHAFLESPEALEPAIDVRRTTASLLYNHPFGKKNNLAMAAVWGRNDPEDGREEDSFLLESEVRLGRTVFYTRIESVQKLGHELALENLEGRLFRIQHVTLGLAREILSMSGTSLQLGAQGTIYRFNDDLKGVYGARPASYQVYLQLRPSSLDIGGHEMHDMHDMGNMEAEGKSGR